MEMEAAIVVCGNEGEMEDNGVFFQCADDDEDLRLSLYGRLSSDSL